ncbi:T9SS type B sorting domain-containing protein [Wenyingzhuangia sp. IMCC45574]
MKKLILLLLFLVSCLTYAQLDDTHYFPPLKNNYTSFDVIDKQAFYFSTPITSNFDVFIYKGTSTTPLDTIKGLSNSNSKKYFVADGTNDITVASNTYTGIPITNSGLRFVSNGGEKFYVNYRCKSENHAGSLTCKGKKALGKDFRWGGVASNHRESILTNNYISFTASEDNTIVTISGYDKNCVFRRQNNDSGISDDTFVINLNKNESYVLEVIANIGTANLKGWLGAKITATKPIVLNSGAFTSLKNGLGDITIDQVVPTNVIGQKYGFIRGNGNNISEFPIIIGTKDNTQIFVNGTLFNTINDGDYLEIPGSFYSGTRAGANLIVEANKKIYAFQCLTGEAGKIQTLGMNFIPPLVCLLPKSFNHISEIDSIAGNPTKASAITIIASSDTSDSEIKVFQNNSEILKPRKPDSSPFIGDNKWKSFFIDNLKGNIRVESTGNIVVGFFVNDGGNAGFAGYFSGFDEVPNNEIELAVEGECLPDGFIKIKDSLQPAYQWYKNGTLIPGATNFKVQIIGAGEYYADIETASGCIYKSESIDITDPDRRIQYDTCIPTRILTTLETSLSGYQWYRDGVLLPGEIDFKADASIPGTYYTELITSAGCVYKSDDYIVLDDIPDSTIDSTYIGSGCVNDGVIKIFKDDPTNYYTYQWYKDGNNIGGANSKEYTITSFGKYHTDIITPDGCVIISDTISVQKPNLTLVRDLVYGCAPNGNLKAVDSLQGSYQWYRNGIALPSANNFKVDLDEIGSYYADIVTPYGCTYQSEKLEVIHCYDLEINKSADKTEILEGGDDLTYFITIENKGYLPVTNLRVTDIIPSRLRFKSFVASIGSWGSPFWTMANLNPGEIAELTLNTTSLVDNNTDSITNLISSSQNEIDSDHTPDDLTETVNVLNGQIEITSVSAELERPYRIIRGDILNFTITIRNVGEILLDNIDLTNSLFTSDLNGYYTNGDTNNNNILDFNETWTYIIPYNITQGQINNLEVLSTTFVDGRQPNNFTQFDKLDYTYKIDQDFVVPYIDLAIALSGNGPGVMIDETVNIDLNLTSDHVSDVNTLTIHAPLPSGFEFLSYNSEVGTYDETTGIWTINTLKRNANTTLNLKSKMLLDGEHTLNAEIGTFNELDSITSNNVASITIKPVCYRVFNEFSPNGDGINDNLVVQCTELGNKISLKIFSRLGALVFESIDYKNEFDGSGNKGIYINKNRRLPNGTYFYVINPNDGTGERNGWIYINR